MSVWLAGWLADWLVGCLFICMEQLSSHWTDILEINRVFFENLSRKFKLIKT
jgi:hypothetical protein